MWVFANRNLFVTCIFFKSGTFLGLRAYRLFSRNTLRTVSTLTDGQTLSLISVAGTKGFLVLTFFIIRLVVCDITDFLPRDSTFSSYHISNNFCRTTQQILVVFVSFSFRYKLFYQTTGFFTTMLSSSHFSKKK